MRRLSTAFAVLLALAFAFAGCSGAKAPAAPAGQLRILTSTFPMYLFTLNVTAGRGDAVSVEPMLSGKAGCPHDYVLTPQDMQKITRAHVFVVNGLGLEEFLGAPVAQANPKIKVLDTSKGIRDVLKLTAEEGEDHHHGDINPHLFASPHMAAEVVRNIAAELSKLDPAGAELYRKNAEAYASRLDALADEFAAAGKELRSRKVVTQHAVFDYLARDAGLEIVAVVEENPGQEPSGAQMLDIVKRIRSSGAAAVFTEPQYSPKVAETIAAEAKVPVASLDPVASGPDAPPLDFYERTMRENLNVLKKTLGGR